LADLGMLHHGGGEGGKDNFKRALGHKNRIVTAFEYWLASNEVKLLGPRRKVDLIPMKSCDETSMAAGPSNLLIGYSKFTNFRPGGANLFTE